MRHVCLALLGLLIASPAFAQSQGPSTPDTAIVLVLPATGDPVTISPVAQRSIVLAQFPALCNLAAMPPKPATATNPKSFYVNDPDPTHPNRFCALPMPIGMPDGTGYRATAVFSVASCVDATGQTVSPCLSDRGVVDGPFDLAPQKTKPVAPTVGAVRP